MRNRFDSSSACSSACRMLPLCWKMKSATDATMPRRSGQLIKTMAEFFIARPHILSRLPASVRHETKCVRLNIANSTRKHRPHTCEPLSSGLKETKEPRPSIGWTEWSPCRGCLWRIVISPIIPQDSPLLRFCDAQSRRGSKDSGPSLPAGTGLRWSLLADFPGPHERQPLEYGSVQVRVGHLADPLSPGGHGSIHAPDHWFWRPCGKSRWCRTLSDVQPRHSRATLDAEVPQFRQRSALSVPPMARQPADTGGDRNQDDPLRSPVPSVCGKANWHHPTRVFGSDAFLDGSRPRKQTARFQDVL